MEAIGSSETSVLIRPTRYHIPEESILSSFLLFIFSFCQFFKVFNMSTLVCPLLSHLSTLSLPPKLIHFILNILCTGLMYSTYNRGLIFICIHSYDPHEKDLILSVVQHLSSLQRPGRL
jgi:hypothetical protein